MIVQPIQYLPEQPQALSGLQQGLEFGANLARVRAAQEAARLAKEERDRARAAQEQFVAERDKFYSNPNPTLPDVLRLQMLMPPTMAAATKDTLAQIPVEQRRGYVSMMAEVVSSLDAKQPNVAVGILENAKQANPAQQASFDRMINTIQSDPVNAFKLISPIISADEEGRKMLEAREKARLAGAAEETATATAAIKAAEAKFAPAKVAADIGLTKAQTDELRAKETRSKQEAADALKGLIPADKRPELEGKFRKEYSDQTKGYQDVKEAYSRVLASGDTAVGDLSLIFGYMKMLDPGSVVREGEFATAQNAAGVPERIVNIYNKIISGERLSESQRKAFKGQAKTLFSQAQNREKTVRSGIERIAKGYGLDTQNIFYEAVESEPTEPTEQSDKAQKPKPVVVPFSGTPQAPAQAAPAERPPRTGAELTRDYQQTLEQISKGQRNVRVEY